MSILKNYIYNTLYQIMLLIVPLITMPYLTRIFLPDQLGINTFSLSVVNYFMLFGALGMQMYGNRQVAYVRNDTERLRITFWSLYLTQLITTILASLLYIIFIFIRMENQIDIYLLQGLNLISVILDISWLFMGLEDFKKVSLRNIIVKLLGLVAIFIFVKSSDDLLVYIFILGFISLIGTLIMWIYIPKDIRKIGIDINVVKKTFIPLCILFLPQIASQVYMLLSRTMIGIFSTEAQVAFYDYSQKIVRMAIALVASVGTVLMPRVSNMNSNGEEEKIKDFVCKAFLFVSYISIPMAFGLMGTSQNIVSWFLGKEYSEVGILTAISSITIIPVSWATIIGVQYLIAIKEENKYTISIVISAIISFICNMILIPKLESMGAIITLIIAEFTGSIVQLIFVRKKLNIRGLIKDISKYTVVSILMFFIVIFLGSLINNKFIASIVQVVIGGLFYIFFMYLLKDSIQMEILNKIKAIMNKN